MKMSLMSKLSAIALISSAVFAATNAEVETFLKKQIGANPSIKSLDITVIDRKPVEAPKGWDALIVNIDAKVKQGKNERKINQKMIYFTNGDFIADNLTNIKTGEMLRNSIAPEFKPEFYTKANLIYGDANAKHKVAIFSDPLCPFCRSFVPKALEYLKKYPKEFAVYYYHFPLEALHPASVTLTKAAIAASLKGRKNVELDMYKININAREKDDKKILEVFNKAMDTNITEADINSPIVQAHVKHDMEVISSLMVAGTPTFYFDGKKDASKKKFRQVKVK